MAVLIAILVLLILLLTGTFVTALGIAGWVLVGIISLAIIFLWIDCLSTPDEIKELRQIIKNRTALGYRADDFERKLEEKIGMLVPDDRRAKEVHKNPSQKWP